MTNLKNVALILESAYAESKHKGDFKDNFKNHLEAYIDFQGQLDGMDYAEQMDSVIELVNEQLGTNYEKYGMITYLDIIKNGLDDEEYYNDDESDE